MTACEAFESEPEAFAKTVFEQSFLSVMGTRGVKAAGWGEERGEEKLVATDQVPKEKSERGCEERRARWSGSVL